MTILCFFPILHIYPLAIMKSEEIVHCLINVKICKIIVAIKVPELFP